MTKLLPMLIALTIALAACGGPQGGSNAPASAPPQAAAGGPTQQPYATLAQVMRAIPFGASNIIFDTQTNDPEAPRKEGGGDSASARFASVYKGWQVVEHNALALSEMSNLLLIPGRLCENGKPVPLDREDFRKFIQGLADAGKAAYKAAQSKNQDQMVEVSDTVATACSNCHEVYREREPRCTPPEQMPK